MKEDAEFVYISYTATVLTAPCIGAIVGGLVTTKLLGSYTNKKALVLCFIAYLLFVIFCIPCPLVNDFKLFIGLLWAAIFMQDFIEPILVGIILNTVTPIERPTACSLFIFIQFLGMFPAPYLYGLIQEKTIVLDEKGNNISRGGMITVFFSSAIGGIGLMIALILRNRSYKKGVDRVKTSIIENNPNITVE